VAHQAIAFVSADPKSAWQCGWASRANSSSSRRRSPPRAWPTTEPAFNERTWSRTVESGGRNKRRNEDEAAPRSPEKSGLRQFCSAFSRPPTRPPASLNTTLAMMQNKSFNPVGISLFGTQAATLQANFLAHAVKQPGSRSAKRLLQRRIQGVHTTPPKICQVVELTRHWFFMQPTLRIASRQLGATFNVS